MSAGQPTVDEIPPERSPMQATGQGASDYWPPEPFEQIGAIDTGDRPAIMGPAANTDTHRETAHIQWPPAATQQPPVYHEKQEAQFCQVHAINNLLGTRLIHPRTVLKYCNDVHSQLKANQNHRDTATLWSSAYNPRLGNFNTMLVNHYLRYNERRRTQRFMSTPRQCSLRLHHHQRQHSVSNPRCHCLENPDGEHGPVSRLHTPRPHTCDCGETRR